MRHDIPFVNNHIKHVAFDICLFFIDRQARLHGSSLREAIFWMLLLPRRRLVPPLIGMLGGRSLKSSNLLLIVLSTEC